MYLVSRMMWVIAALSPSLFLPIYLNLPNISHTVCPYTPTPPSKSLCLSPSLLPFFSLSFLKFASTFRNTVLLRCAFCVFVHKFLSSDVCAVHLSYFIFFCTVFWFLVSRCPAPVKSVKSQNVGNLVPKKSETFTIDTKFATFARGYSRRHSQLACPLLSFERAFIYLSIFCAVRKCVCYGVCLEMFRGRSSLSLVRIRSYRAIVWLSGRLVWVASVRIVTSQCGEY